MADSKTASIEKEVKAQVKEMIIQAQIKTRVVYSEESRIKKQSQFACVCLMVERTAEYLEEVFERRLRQQNSSNSEQEHLRADESHAGKPA